MTSLLCGNLTVVVARILRQIGFELRNARIQCHQFLLQYCDSIDRILRVVEIDGFVNFGYSVDNAHPD